VIDGELFEARHDQDMVLTAPHVVRWLIPA